MTDEYFTADWFSKPGDSLRLLMQRRCVAPSDLARRIEGGMVVVRGILDGSVAIDLDTAKTLSKAVGGTSNFWLKRQANYDLALERAVCRAEKYEADEWLGRVPTPGAKSRGQLSDARRREEIQRRIVFFNVANMAAWEIRYGRLRDYTRFRTSASFTSKEGAVVFWLRRGELEADLVATQSWSPDNLRDRVPQIRKLCRVSHPNRFLPKFKELCAEAGIALVVVAVPKGCHASGASRLVAPNKAMILLSFRYRADDQFWFTVFHEIGHLLLHGAQTFVDDENTPDDKSEREANEFASSCIIPEARKAELERLPANRDAIIRFSVSVGISPGLTVGQMQHRRLIGHQSLNSLKRHWTWNEIDSALT
jgi:HTH-type transcriptional regulator / antitoxin HigA